MTSALGPLQQPITAYWNTRGDDYDTRPLHGIHDPRERTAWLDVLRRFLPPPPADVLDVGTGTGFLALLLAELGYTVTGVDLAHGMLEAARRKAIGESLQAVFALGNAIDPPGDAGSFDVITNRSVLWTLIDPARAFANWYRLLRPGGRVMAIDSVRASGATGAARRPHPGYTQETDAALTLRHLTSPDTTIGLARQAGFGQVEATLLDEVNQLERELHPGGERESSSRYVLVARKD